MKLVKLGELVNCYLRGNVKGRGAEIQLTFLASPNKIEMEQVDFD